jgi:hypothetical protein
MTRGRLLSLLLSGARSEEQTADLPADVLEDRIRGGRIGQTFGNLLVPPARLAELWRANMNTRTAAIGELKKFPNVLRRIYDAPQPQGARIRAAARAEGLEKLEKLK